MDVRSEQSLSIDRDINTGLAKGPHAVNRGVLNFPLKPHPTCPRLVQNTTSNKIKREENNSSEMIYLLACS